VACHATQHANIPVSPNVLEASAEVVHKIRIVLRFLLGAIHDLWPDSGQNTDKSLYFLDRYLLHLLFEFSENVRIS
jgi:isoleucyl-tRNA synthetase